MRQIHFKAIAATAALGLVLAAPASAYALNFDVASTSATTIRPALVLATDSMTGMLALASTQVSYDAGMDPRMMQVFEGTYTNNHPEQVEDIQIRVRKYAHPSGALLEDSYVPVKNDYIVGSGESGTYHVELPMSASVMWSVTGPYAMHGMSMPKRLTATVTSSSVDAEGARHYFGSVKNDSVVGVALTDVVVSARETVGDAFFAEASDSRLVGSGAILRSLESTSFELVATRPTAGETLSIAGVKAEGRFQAVLGITASTLVPDYGAYVGLTGALRGPSASLIPSQTVTFTGTSLNSKVALTTKVVTWSGSRYYASITAPYATKYRVRFDGDSNYGAAVSSEIQVTPKVYLTTPAATATQYYGTSYTAYGYIKPRHTAGTYAVRIYRWRLVSGVWKSYGYVSAKASDYSTYSKYSVATKMPYKGSWRLRATHVADSLNAATNSGYRYITVK